MNVEEIKDHGNDMLNFYHVTDVNRKFYTLCTVAEEVVCELGQQVLIEA